MLLLELHGKEESGIDEEHGFLLGGVFIIKKSSSIPEWNNSIIKEKKKEELNRQLVEIGIC